MRCGRGRCRGRRRCRRGRCRGRGRCGEGKGGAGLTWLIVVIVNPLALSLTCWGLCSPAGPVVVSLPARVIVNPLTPALVMSCRPPCARRSLAGAVVAPRCCREPAGAVATRLCCREPTGTVVTCRPHLRRVICAFVVGWCWPPLVLIASHRPSLRLLRRVIRPCACRVMSVSCHPPRICCVVWVFVMSSRVLVLCCSRWWSFGPAGTRQPW